MVALRKSAVLLALLGLVVLSSGTAQAQTVQNGLVTCTATAVPPIVRAEGIAELVGDIVLTCIATPGAPTVQGLNTFLVNISVSLNVNITNNFSFNDGGVSDAVLIINENNCTSPQNTGSVFNGCMAPDARFQDPQFGARPANAENRLDWNQVSFPIPGACEVVNDPTCAIDEFFPQTTTLRVTALRANAAQLGVPDTQVFPSTQIRAFVSITGPTTISVNNNDLNVAIPIVGLLVTTDNVVEGLQCIDGHDSATLTVEEGFATAFKTLGAPTFFPGNTQWESGYYAPGSNTNNGGAKQGTRFLVRFFNIPEGVEIQVPNGINHYTLATTGAGPFGTSDLNDADSCIFQAPTFAAADNTALTGGTLTLSRLTELKAACTSDDLEIQRVSGADADGENGSLVTSGGTHSFEASGGVATLVYEVVDSDPFRVEDCDIPITFWWEADTANDRPQADITGQVSASFAPLSATFLASDDSSEAEPRFIDTSGDPAPIITIRRCTTTLLFPFVTNQRTFDTGIAISNTSEDWLDTQPQTGSCEIHYHGSTVAGGAAPETDQSNDIPGGGQLVFTLSGGNIDQGIEPAVDFQGYIIAECEFQYAHGFAFITNGFGGLPSLAQGYLALVIPRNLSGDRVPGVPGLHNLGESLSH